LAIRLLISLTKSIAECALCWSGVFGIDTKGGDSSVELCPCTAPEFPRQLLKQFNAQIINSRQVARRMRGI
jgi:hypothetical protein